MAQGAVVPGALVVYSVQTPREVLVEKALQNVYEGPAWEIGVDVIPKRLSRRLGAVSV